MAVKEGLPGVPRLTDPYLGALDSTLVVGLLVRDLQNPGRNKGPCSRAMAVHWENLTTRDMSWERLVVSRTWSLQLKSQNLGKRAWELAGCTCLETPQSFLTES